MEGGRGIRGRAARWGESSASPRPESNDEMLRTDCLRKTVGAVGREILLNGK